ncbi:MAG: ribonuclease P [Candidatus Bathyarchaeia archaeon]
MGEDRRIALKRIHRLFEEARRVADEDPDLAKRYAHLARRISLRMRVGIPKRYKRWICPRCKSFLIPSENCRVRLRQGREPHIAITCGECGFIQRVPYGGG